jgi:ribose transport system permease protein
MNSAITASVPTNDQDNRPRSILRTIALRQETWLLAVVILIAIVTGLKNPNFLASDNLVEVLRASVIYFIMGCGAALLVIGGGLDFSVGSVFTISALVGTLLISQGVPIPIGILAAVATGCLVGVVNHLIVTFWHVPPIIATLGTFFITLGLSALITGGNDVVPLPQEFLKLGQGSVLFVPSIVWYALIVGLIFWFLLEKTRFGINVRAVGGNRQAAIGNGLKVRRIDLTLYVLAGATAAVAGLIYSARVGAGQVEAGGPSVTLVVVTGVLIGGVSLLGGLGSITGVAVGAVLLSVIDNALVLAQIPPQFNNVIIGTILIGAVAVDHLRRQQLYKPRS